VQLMQPRGAVVALEPSKEPSEEPSAARAHLREALPIDDRGLGGSAGEFFAAIAAGWRLSAAQRDRLAARSSRPRWTRDGAGGAGRVTGGNTDGVRNPYAVLAARLSSAELPAPPARLITVKIATALSYTGQARSARSSLSTTAGLIPKRWASLPGNGDPVPSAATPRAFRAPRGNFAAELGRCRPAVTQRRGSMAKNRARNRLMRASRSVPGRR
jgi:hypothetical protein